MGKKKKLTKGQLRRVKANQARRLARDVGQEEIGTDALGPDEIGRIVSRFGQHADVLSEDGAIFRCNIRRNIESLVTGDRVIWRRANESEQGMQGVVEGRVEGLGENRLQRPDIPRPEVAVEEARIAGKL